MKIESVKDYGNGKYGCRVSKRSPVTGVEQRYVVTWRRQHLRCCQRGETRNGEDWYALDVPIDGTPPVTDYDYDGTGRINPKTWQCNNCGCVVAPQVVISRVLPSWEQERDGELLARFDL